MGSKARAGLGATGPRATALAVWAAAVAPAIAPAAIPGRTTIGVYGGWGAFRDVVPARCFAIARPVAAEGRSGGFADVATWIGSGAGAGAGRGLRASFHARLSRPRDRSAAVTLSIGERRFVLAAGARDAWATDGLSDRAIVDAMRGGRSMSVEGVGAGGVPFADTYALTGAATAIDAAALACAGR